MHRNIRARFQAASLRLKAFIGGNFESKVMRSSSLFLGPFKRRKGCRLPSQLGQLGPHDLRATPELVLPLIQRRLWPQTGSELSSCL